MREPLVSVIISTYNEEKYILEALNSILHQDYKNIEIIIIDDASTDRTVELIQSLQTDKIKLYINDSNKKLAHNLNYALSKARGKYLARMDADDISRPSRIRIQVCYLEEHKDIDVVASFAKTFGDSHILKKSPCSHRELEATLLFTNPICHPTVMFRKSSIDFQYDESCAHGQDYELWTRIIDKKRFYVMNKVLLDYRVIKRQRASHYLKSQRENALKARKSLFTRLFGVESETYWDRFKMLVDVDSVEFQPKTEEQMQSLIQFADLMLQKNAENKVFDETEFFGALSNVIFLQWYLSLLKTDVSAHIFMKSNYIEGLQKQNFRIKLKAMYKVCKVKKLN